MKFIEKLLKNEPESLRTYRITTPNATYSGYPHPAELKLSLLQEQGGICAYCMQRISLDSNDNYKPKIEVEHIKSQKFYIGKSLDYNNMIGVCNGNSKGIEHCDKSKKSYELKKLIPVDKHCEEYIMYSTSGQIKSKSNNQEIEHDINVVLNLNNQHLVDKRKNVADLIINNLKRKYPIQDWTKRIFDKEIETYKSKNKSGEYYEFCNYIVWYLEHLKKSPRYN
jgi:uncharacterized protein (TIGR02646 family)